MSKAKKIFGREGERIACEYLERCGLVFVEANYKVWGGELDLIMSEGSEIVFVEVKSRQKTEYQQEQLVGRKQIHKLISTAERWLKHHNYEDIDWRIDFCGVFFHTDRIGYDVEWYRNAIY